MVAVWSTTDKNYNLGKVESVFYLKPKTKVDDNMIEEISATIDCQQRLL